MSNSKKSDLNGLKESHQMIICAIDCLKGRKARPDELKICNFVQRRFGLKKDYIIHAIDEAVKDGSVLKIKYKDEVSYRNPAKFNKKMQNHLMSIDGKCTPQVIKRVLRELRVLSRSALNGVQKQSLVDSFAFSSSLINQSLIDRVLSRAIEAGSVKLLPNGNYILSCGKRIVPRKRDPDQTASSSKLFTDVGFYPAFDNGVNNNNDNKDNKDNGDEEIFNKKSDEMLNKTDDLEINEDSSMVSNGTSISSDSAARKKCAPVVKRERPISKRKKFKKSLGPDFIESSELGLQYMRHSFEPKCDLCQRRSKSNKRGEREELLSCKDCSAKAHPSCMDYSEELAERSSRSPWQCMDCKTCTVCGSSRDGINMLVCDFCDKGFHMSCNYPPVKEKPNGKWECNECSSFKNHIKNDVKNDININNTKSDSFKCENTVQKIQNNQSNDGLPLIKVTQNTMNKQLSDTSLSSSASDLKEYCFNGYPEVVPNPQKWSAKDVENFIHNIGFPEQSVLFKEQEIDGTSLLLLRRTDVLTGFEMKLGPALKIYSHIMRLQKNE